MENNDIAAIFSNMADLLEIRGEKPFRINAYRRAARTIEDLTEDVRELAEEKTLAKLPGIGKSTVEKIHEFLEIGKISAHEELLASIPEGLPPLLEISGLGPKKVALFWNELSIEGLDELKAAIADGSLAKLKGMGEKSVAQIAAGIDLVERSTGRTPLGMAWQIALEMREAMSEVKGVRRVELAGSLRRGSETIGDLDILCESSQGQTVVDAFTSQPAVKRVLASGETKGSVLVERRDGEDLQVDCRVVPAESFGSAWQYFTGSKEHNVRLRELAQKKGWKLNEWGLFKGERRLAGKEEEGVYKKLGLPYIPPEMREDRGELNLDEIEPLVELGDIRGDMHMHTTASDGTAGAETMAKAAHELGYQYIAITDHSQASTIANGLSINRMWQQIEHLRTLNDKLSAVTILVGCECDILSDGTLDYPDQILAACDFVVASIHSAMRQPKDRVTGRTLDAMDNPYVAVIGHPTGRLLHKREAMAMDVPAVIAKAAETHTAMELNAAWQRLDLHDRHLRMAREAGTMVCLGTDSHSVAQFDQMKLGVLTARRGWLRAQDILNTRPLPTVRNWLKRKRK